MSIIDKLKQGNNQPSSGNTTRLAKKLQQFNPLDYNSTFEDDYFQMDVPKSMFLTGRENPLTTVQDGGLEELKAQRQPWIAKTSAGVARVGTKALTEVGKIPGVVGGIAAGTTGQVSDWLTGEDNTDFMSVAFDNAWIRSLNDANEWINEEVLPVYVKKAVQDGKFWDKALSMDFYATDGADGLGYIAAMLAPGAIINRLKLGKNLVGLLAKSGKIDEADDIIKFAEKVANIRKTEKGVSKASRLAELGLPTNPGMIDLYAQTIANTTLEAGAEAQQAGKEYEDNNLYRTKLDPSNPNYLSEEDLINTKAKLMANVFGANAAILIGPNAIMSKMLWGGARNSARNATKAVADKTGIKAAPDLTLAQKVGNSTVGLVKGGAREGLWEEGMQSTAGNYFGDNPEASFGSFLNSLPAAYMEMAGSTDGQMAMYLGALFGGPMNVVSDIKESKKEKETFNKLIDLANIHIADFTERFKGDAFLRNDEGYILRDEKNRPVIDDPFVLLQNLQELEGIEKMSALYDRAVLAGNVEDVKQLRSYAVASLVRPFLINDDLGLETLRQYLNNDPGVAEMAKNEGVTEESIIEDMMDQAYYLQKSLKTFEDFGDTLIKFNNPKATENDINKYYNKLNEEYYTIKSGSHFVNKRLKELNEQLHSIILGDTPSTEEVNSEGEIDTTSQSQDARIDDISKNIRLYHERKKELEKLENQFWSSKLNQDKFNKYVEEARELEEALNDIEKMNEVEEASDSIKNATTPEEVDEVPPTNTDADNILEEEKKAQKAKLEAEKEAKRQETIRKQQEEAERNKREEQQKDTDKEDTSNWIDTNINEGEEITLTKSQLAPYSEAIAAGTQSEFEVLVTGKSESTVSVLVNETGEILDLPKKSKKVVTPSPEINNHVEGSINDYEENYEAQPNETNTTIAQENNEANTGAKLVATDEKGTPLKWVKEQYAAFLEWMNRPMDKTNMPVQFEVNENIKGQNDLWDNALKGYKKVLNGQSITEKQKNHLIDYLPLTAIINNTNVKAPLYTKPAKPTIKDGESKDAFAKRLNSHDLSINIYNKTSRVLRKKIIEALINKVDIKNISTVIEGQYGGVLQVSPKTVENKVAVNPILSLYHFNGMSDSKKLEYIKKNIATVNDIGDFMYLDGRTEPFVNKAGKSKSNAAGEVYLMIPKANGKTFPLKLNIEHVSKKDATLVAKIYKSRLSDPQIGLDTLIKDIPDSSIFDMLTSDYADVIKLIGKNKNEIMIRDVIDFFIWDGTDNHNTKTRIGITTRGDNRIIEYGSFSRDINSFKEEDLIEWIYKVKRYNISIKPKKNSTSNAHLKTNDKYISHLLETKKLNTNAVVNKPTFGGYTSIYLDSNNVTINGKPQKTVETKDKYKDAINSVKQDKNGNWTAEYERAEGIFQQIKGKDESDILRQINNIRDKDLKTEPTGAASNTSGIKPTSTSTDVKVTTNSGNITIKEDGKMFYDNGNEVTEDNVKNKALVKKEHQDGTLRRSEYNGSKYAVLSDDRIISLNQTSAGKEVYKKGKARDIILENANPKQVNSLSEAVPNNNSSLNVENNDGKIRNSQKDSVSLQKNNNLSYTKENFKSLQKELTSKGLLAVGSDTYNKIMENKSDKNATYKAMQEVLAEFERNKDNITKDCKTKI